MHQQHLNKNLDRQTGGEGDRQRERQRGRVKRRKELSNRARKRTPEGKRGKKKAGWERRAGGGQKDEERLEPKWQPLHLSPPPVIRVYPSLCSVIPHLSIPAPIPLSLSLSISLFSCSLVDLLRQGWRVQALQRLQCGDCVSCGSHSSLACRLHRQLLLQLILNQLALSSSAFQRSQTAATSDSRAVCLINSPSGTRYGPYKAVLNKNIWHKPELIQG